MAASNVSALPERPKPPSSLKGASRSEWERIVNRMPVDWFTAETLSTLERHCLHVAEAKEIDKLIDLARVEAGSGELANYLKLLKARETETRAILSCSTKMRLLQQSTYTDKAGGTAKRNSAGTSKPWSK